MTGTQANNANTNAQNDLIRNPFKQTNKRNAVIKYTLITQKDRAGIEPASGIAVR
jgi:hypothetical protein